MALNQIRPRCLYKLDLHSHRLLIAQYVEINRVSFEFAFHHFLELCSLTFQFDICITRDGMTIDSEKNITWPKNVGRRPRLHYCRYQHAAVVIFQSEKLSLRGVLQFRIADRKIDIFVVMPIADIL